MRDKTRLIKKIVIIGITVCLLMTFFLPFTKHGILTLLYGAEFEGLYIQDNWISDVDSFRVLSYSSNYARVYYIGTIGSVLEFSKESEVWVLTFSQTVWSNAGGNADGFIWPYFYHSIGGILFILLLVFLYSSLLCYI